jgi:Integrase zinc binding domain
VPPFCVVSWPCPSDPVGPLPVGAPPDALVADFISSKLSIARSARFLAHGRIPRVLAQWSLYLSHFNFHLTHKLGTTNTQADPLSRISTHLMTDADDNHDQIVLQPGHFASVAATSIEESNTLEQQIRDATDQDPEVTLAIQLLKEHGPRQVTNGLADWEQRDGLTFYKGQVYIPKAPDLRRNIVCLCHDSPSTGHPGRHGTNKLVSQLYWWPSMTSFINKYVAGCDTCQRCKPARHPCSTL